MLIYTEAELGIPLTRMFTLMTLSPGHFRNANGVEAPTAIPGGVLEAGVKYMYYPREVKK